MKKRTKFLKETMAVLLAAAMLSGCGTTAKPASEESKTSTASEEKKTEAESKETTSKEAAQEDVTLTFWTPTWRQAAEEPIIADFMEKYPNIKIDVTYMSSDDIKSNTKIAASSGTLPDMWYNWGGVLAEFYAENGLSLDLTDYAKKNNWSDKYLAGAMEQCEYQGQLIGLPQNLVGLVMYYRTDIFKKYGIEVPTTFADLEKACETLVKNGVTPFSSYSAHMMRYSEALIEYYGGKEEHDKLLTLEGDWSKSEAVTKSFEKLKEWNDKKYFPDGVLTADTSTAKMYVYSGTSAMIMENPGMASEIMANGYDPEQYGWFAFPTESNEDGTGRLSAFVKMCQFNAGITEEKLNAAMLFWDYYYSDESIAAHAAIEQPTARIGVKLPDNYALADGMLDLINKNGGFSTMDLKVPAEVMSQYFAAQDGVILGTVDPGKAGADIQAAILSYQANQ